MARGRKPKRKPQPTEPSYRNIGKGQYVVNIDSYIRLIEQKHKNIV